MKIIMMAVITLLIVGQPALAAGGGSHGESKELAFPPKLETLPKGDSVWETVVLRAQENPLLALSSFLFLLAIVHTFCAPKLMSKAHAIEHEHHTRIHREGRTGSARPQDDAEDDVSLKGTIFHYLGEVEAVFFTWAMALVAGIASFDSWGAAVGYIESVNYTEPVFVVIIMAIASTRPVLQFSEKCLDSVAGIGGRTPQAWWITILILAPLLGSFITEPAAMTIAALLLKKKVYDLLPSKKLAYGTLGLLFVNISVGGTLSHFAAPPVLMVAAPWEWGFGFMFFNFGLKAVVGIVVATALYFLFLRKEFQTLQPQKHEDTVAEKWVDRTDPVPIWVTLIHILFLGWTVFNAHHVVFFVGGFMVFMAFREATNHYQHPLSLKTPLLVGLFLAGLVIHGGLQGWWISPVLSSLGEWPLMIGATGLTAINDNAAITFLATQVSPELADSLKYAVVAGAVTGGGLTVIANAPNPAGQAILGKTEVFKDGISALGLLKGALVATLIMGAAFMLLPW